MRDEAAFSTSCGGASDFCVSGMLQLIAGAGASTSLSESLEVQDFRIFVREVSAAVFLAPSLVSGKGLLAGASFPPRPFQFIAQLLCPCTFCRCLTH